MVVYVWDLEETTKKKLSMKGDKTKTLAQNFRRCEDINYLRFFIIGLISKPVIFLGTL